MNTARSNMCFHGHHTDCEPCDCECHQIMKITQHYHRESGYRLEIFVESKDTETHAALTDLKDYHKELIKTHMYQLGQLVDKLLLANKKM